MYAKSTTTSTIMGKLLILGILSSMTRIVAWTYTIYGDEELISTTTLDPNFGSETSDFFSDTETTTFDNGIDLGFTTTTTDGMMMTTTDKELLYLEREFEFTDREEFWNDNPYECHDGKLIPSPYLRRKYWECDKIHHRHNNPKCIVNCRSAITMLLGQDRVPHIELYEVFFKLVLPESLHEAAVIHYQQCFDKFGNNTKIFLDYSCEGPQQFYSCAHEFKQFMVC